jgi:RND family efflux transporter MFP subunit
MTMPNLKTIAYQSARGGATLVVVAAALYGGWRMWTHYQRDPWTRDGRVRADIVQIAPDVAGLVTEILVRHDQKVRRGQTLFRIDRVRYELAVRQAETAIATQSAAIAVLRAAAEAHRANLAELQREAARNDSLGSLVAREATEQSHSKVAVEQAALAQATASVAQAEAAVTQAQAARDVAELNLQRTEISAPTDGTMSDIGVRVGDYVSPGRPVLALIDAASLRVEGYFEETKLRKLKIGQKVEIALMGETKPLSGHIVSIAAAIEDRERGPSTSLLPNVNPTFSWVRLAQRIPVRIALDQAPDDPRLIAGRTATVTVIEGAGK